MDAMISADNRSIILPFCYLDIIYSEQLLKSEKWDNEIIIDYLSPLYKGQNNIFHRIAMNSEILT